MKKYNFKNDSTIMIIESLNEIREFSFIAELANKSFIINNEKEKTDLMIKLSCGKLSE